MSVSLAIENDTTIANEALFGMSHARLHDAFNSAYMVIQNAKDTAFIQRFTQELVHSTWPLLLRLWLILQQCWWQIGLSIFLAAVAYDQYSYRSQKGVLAGSSWKVPFVGHLLKSLDPNFPEWLKTMDLGISCVSVLHRFVVIIPSTDVVRKVLNAGDKTKLAGCDALETYLRPGNFIFMDGKPHVEFRKGLNSLFTKQALARYLPVMEAAYDLHFQKFLDISQATQGKPKPFMKAFQDMLCCVSCRTFCGEHIAEEMVEKIAADFWLITAALELVNFPIALPYTKAWYGKKATELVVAEFIRCATRSRAKMTSGGTVTCVVDAWILQMLQWDAWRRRDTTSIAESEKPTGHEIRMFSDIEIGESLLVFLFAAQDASTSAVTWLFQYLGRHPEWRDDIREEQLRLRGGDRNKPVTTDMIDAMQITRACVKETLRSRPPPIMLARKVRKPFAVTDDFTARKGQMLMVSLWSPLHDPDAYPEPDEWRPQRWISGNAEDQTRNWLAFGTGPHSCLGQTYAQLNLAALVGRATLYMDWIHCDTGDNGIKIFATIYPKDDCHLIFSKTDATGKVVDRS